MKNPLKYLLSDEDGVTAIEYGLLAALISLAAFIFFQLVGVSLSDFFSFAGKEINDVATGGTGT